MKVFCSIRASTPGANDSLRNVCRHKIFDSKHQNHFEASYERLKVPKMPLSEHPTSPQCPLLRAARDPGRGQGANRSDCRLFPASIHSLLCRYLCNSNFSVTASIHGQSLTTTHYCILLHTSVVFRDQRWEHVAHSSSFPCIHTRFKQKYRQNTHIEKHYFSRNDDMPLTQNLHFFFTFLHSTQNRTFDEESSPKPVKHIGD